MTKILKLQNNILQFDYFPAHKEFDIHWEQFLKSDLGRIYQAIPWDDLCKVIGRKLKKKNKGPKAQFDIRGKLGLMFLKAYLDQSDQKLIQRFNTDYSLQFFCQMYLRPGEWIKDFKIVSKIRCELARVMEVDRIQQLLTKAWKPYIHHPHILLEDATCYETQMRYPTDVKLLWECCEWLYGQMKRICKRAKMAMPRNKFAEQKSKYLSYSKCRKKSYKKTKARKRSLLYLLNKLNGQLDEIEGSCINIEYQIRYYNRRTTIHKIYEQQKYHFETGGKIQDRIVSISKNYIRPIVRGKETKRVEFGAKVNMIQIDGLNFIEHLSFNAFNESTHLQNSVYLARKLMGKCTHLAADQIYATNANRRYCSHNGITTSFVRKGRAGKLEHQRKQMQQILAKHRATRLEGRFGVEKNFYSLSRIKAKTASTEILWIFFGVHTANAVEIGKRIRQREESFQKTA